MNEYQRFALEHFLADYPEDKTFDEVLELVEAGEATVWQPFEYHQPDDVVEYINNLVDALTEKFVPKG